MLRLCTTLCFFLFLSSTSIAQLSGVYLVDNGGSGDFSSLADMAEAVNTQGLSGAVVIQLVNGVYAEQIILNTGTNSSSNTLLIESLSGDTSDVFIRYFDATDDAQYVIRFEEMGHVTVRNITFDTSDSDNGTVIEIIGEAESFAFMGNRFIGDRNGSAIKFGSGQDFFDPINPMNGLTVSDCYFTLFSPAIKSSEFAFQTNHVDIEITSNEFFDSDALALHRSSDVLIADNYSHGGLFVVSGYSLSACKGVLIENNVLLDSYSSIGLVQDTSSTAHPFIVRNNFISGAENLLVMNSCIGVQVLHNSFRSDDNTSEVISVLDFLTEETDLNIMNNIFYQANPDGGLINSGLDYFQTDYFKSNAWYSEGYLSRHIDTIDFSTEYITDFEEFLELAEISDDNVNVQPGFASEVDLHVSASNLNAGLSTLLVLTDIDGETRNPLTPTIGADEIAGQVAAYGLRADTVFALDDAFEGQNMLVQWDVSNAGANVIYGPWEDMLWLSTDTILSADDVAVDSVLHPENLPGLSSYSRQLNALLPFGITGSYYLLLRTDSDLQYFDPDIDDIAVSDLIDISEVAKPDLVVTSIQLPNNPFSGTEITIEFVVTNTGDAATTGAWTDRIYLSNELSDFDDPLQVPEAVTTFSLAAPTGLGAGESYTGLYSYELPVDLGGQHYVMIYTDRNDAISEGTGEVNNSTVSDMMFVAQSPLPDLIVTDISVPATTFAGEIISVSFTIENIGEANTVPTELPFNFYFGWVWAPFLGTNWLDYLYFRDSEEILNTGAYSAVLEHSEPDLAPDETYTVTIDYQVPSCITGNHFIHIAADRWNHVQESAESNNGLWSDAIEVILAPTPDLNLQDIQLPASPMYSGTSIDIGYVVNNFGPIDVLADSTDWFDQFYLSPVDSLVPDLFTSIGTYSPTTDLLAGGEYSATVQLELPFELYGDMFLVAFCDAGNSICETPFEENNFMAIPVTILQTPPPDLHLVSAFGFEDQVAGGTLDLELTVSNMGEGPTLSSSWIDGLRLFPEGVNSNARAIDLDLATHIGNLQSGEEYVHILQVLLPLSLDTGYYDIHHNIDVEDDVYEDIDLLVNDTIFTIYVSHDESVVSNLEALSIEPLEPLLAGATVPIQYEVHNSSISTSATSWFDRLQLHSLNGTFLAANHHLHIGGLGQGANYIDTIYFDIPSGLEGPYELILDIDTTGANLEYNLDNNHLPTVIDVSLPPWSDLVPTFIDIPSSVASGQEFGLTYTVVQSGSAPVLDAEWVDRVYLSTDDIIDANDILLWTFEFSMDMSTGDTYSKDTLVRVPMTLTGDFFVIVCTDVLDEVYEHIDEDNNHIASIQPIAVSLAPPVDFSLEYGTLYDEFDYSAVFNVTVTNTSTNDATGSWISKIYVSEDDSWDYTDPLIGQHNVGPSSFDTPSPLVAGDSYNATLAGSLPGLKAGVYHYIIRYDAFNYVNESDEGNNVFVSPPLFIDNIPLIVADSVYVEEFFVYGKDYFKIDVPEEKGMLVKMRHIPIEGLIGFGGDPIHDILVSESDVPTSLDYDFTTLTPLQEDHDVLVSVREELRRDFIRTQSLYIPPHYHPDSLSRTVYSIETEFKEFSVFGVSPDTVGTLHNITLTIDGFDFNDSLHLELRSPNDTIVAYESYVNSTEKVIAYFDPRDHGLGSYDLFMEKVNLGNSTTAHDVVTINDGGWVEPFIAIEAPDVVLIAEGAIAKVVYGNHGLVNGYDYALVVAFKRTDVDTTALLDVSFIGTDNPAYDDPNEDPLIYGTEELINHGDMLIYSSYIPVFNNEFTGELFFDIDMSVQDIVECHAFLWQLPRSEFTVSGRLDDYIYSVYPYILDSIIVEDLGIPLDQFRPVTGGCSKILRVSNMEQRIAKEVKKVAEIASGSKSVLTDFKKNLATFFDNSSDAFAKAKAAKEIYDTRKKFNIPPDDTPFSSEVKDVFNCIGTEARQCNITTSNSCGKAYTCTVGTETKTEWKDNGSCAYANPKKKKSWPIRFRESLDPNEMVGPAGVSDLRWVAQDAVMDYTILFENIETAGAAAREVFIDNILPEELLLQTFRLHSFGFAGLEFDLGNSPIVQQTFELPASYGGRLVHLIAGVNPISRKAFWEFGTLDPGTGQLVTDPFGGFLLPNDSTGVGQGWVKYRIDLAPAITDVVHIDNQAEIVFDDNGPIVTNIWSNVTGDVLLASEVIELPQYSDESFEVQWRSITNDGLAMPVEAYDIYVQKDDEGAVIWKQGVTQMNAWYQGEEGHEYRFYSQAIAEGGEKETFHTTWDASTKVLSFPLTPSADDPLLLYPTPAADFVYLQYYVSAEAPVRIRIYDMLGRIYFERAIDSQSAGAYSERFDKLDGLGVFFVEVLIGGERYVRRGLHLQE